MFDELAAIALEAGVFPVASPEGDRSAIFDGPLHIRDVSAVRTLRMVLDRHGFTCGAVADALGSALPFPASHLRDDLPLYLRRVAAPTPINTLVKLFVLDRGVDESRAAAAFAPLDLDVVREMGLVADGPRGIRALLRLSVHDGLVIAHDADDDETRAPGPEHVLDVNAMTLALSNLTVRRPVARALEIGTGCGALALRAARHARQVVATDTNPRALNVAAFNAAVNDVTNIEWRLGSLFEPVDGERFNLIFCNPPHVVSPDSQFIHRDGGRGDALCEEIVRRAPHHLSDGGFATVLINWAIRHGEEWSAPLRRWVKGSGCDSWLMMSAAEDPLAYAAIWNRSRDRDAYSFGIDRWSRYFKELDLKSIGIGAVVLRRGSDRANWVRADHMPDRVTSEAGPHIERLFDAEDRLGSLDDGALLTKSFRAARDHSLRQVLLAKDGGGYVIDTAEVRLVGGLPLRGSVDAYATELLSQCDGRRPLSAVAAAIAAANDLDPVTFAPACATIARRLIASGFLIS